MATGAQCVLGGSDCCVLWTIPRGGPHGEIAYVFATATFLAWCWLLRKYAARRATSAQ